MGRRAAEPTARQLQVLRLMVLPILEQPVPRPPPTLREVMAKLGVASTHTVFCHLQALVAKGLLEKIEGRQDYWPTAAGKARILDALTVEARERALGRAED